MPSLRAATIRLANENPAIRPHLLKLLAAEGDKEGEDDKLGRFTEGPKGKKEFDAWIKNQPEAVQKEWDSNKDKYKNKFKSATERLYMAAVNKRNAGCEKLPEGPMRDNCEKKKEEGKDDKEASLRSATIRLAKANSTLRPHLLKILAAEGRTAKGSVYDGVVAMWLEKDKAGAKKDPEASAEKLMGHLKRLKAWSSSDRLEDLVAVIKTHL